jgi:RNA methyltransferase, TrmH family
VIVSGEVTSIRSPRVKAARMLGRRSFRQRTHSFLAEGPQAVREALAAGAPDGSGSSAVVTELLVTAAAWGRYDDLIAQARGLEVPVHAVSGEVTGPDGHAAGRAGRVPVRRHPAPAADRHRATPGDAAG